MEHDIHHKELWPLSREQLEQRFGVPVSRAANLPVIVNTEAKLEFPADFGRPGVCKLLICPVCARAGTTHEKKPCLQISWNIDWHKNPHNSKNPGHNARVVASLVTLEEAWQSGALQHTAAAVLKFVKGVSATMHPSEAWIDPRDGQRPGSSTLGTVDYRVQCSVTRSEI